jgi:OOP family OmpA-OmpF porin
MYILKNAQGKILLDGYVENKDEHDKLINHAYKLFGKENVVNNLVEKSNAPKDWIYINEFSLDKLKDVDYGDMNITNTSYVFNAHLPSNDKKLDFLNSIREVMSNPENHYGRYRGDYIVTAPIAGAKPIKNLDEKIRSKDKIVKNKITKSPCQIALDDAISSRKIHFDYDKDNIKQESYIILDDVVRALKNCDLESLDMLEIAGHTDSIGSSIYNKRLSQKRANNIKAYLVNHGFNSNKIKAAGYGESKPIASNMTKDGRAKNRRIEFIVKGVR